MDGIAYGYDVHHQSKNVIKHEIILSKKHREYSKKCKQVRMCIFENFNIEIVGNLTRGLYF